MIIAIDGLYFNPLHIVRISQRGENVEIHFTNSSWITLLNWTVENVAEHINSYAADICCINTTLLRIEHLLVGKL